MQLEGEDLYWCTADPAWITGIVYGILAPFGTGARQVQYSGTYNAENWLKMLETLKVNVWYTAPTALRMLMQEDENKFSQHDFSSLKRMYSVGEPLNPEIYHWGRKVFKVEIYDTWWQSETGSMMIGNHPPMTVKPGSMGKPRAGVEALICDDDMRIQPDGKQGLLCLRKGWGSMFRNYFRNDAAYAEKFNGDIYTTGDLAWRDEEGYFWYVSRADDVINTAGHLVGPFEVESALLEIEEIVDALGFQLIFEQRMIDLAGQDLSQGGAVDEHDLQERSAAEIGEESGPRYVHVLEFCQGFVSCSVWDDELHNWRSGRHIGHHAAQILIE